MKAFEDSVDSNIDYMKVRETFINYLKAGYIKRQPDKIVLESYFNPLINSAKTTAERLQAFSCFSCLDSLIFLLCNEVQLTKILSESELALYKQAIPEELISFYKSEFKNLNVDHFDSFLESTPRFKELSFFRNSSNFDDVPCIYDYRLKIEALASSRLGTVEDYIGTSAVSLPIDTCQMKELTAGKCDEVLNINNINPITCGNFHRTIYLVWMIENKLNIDLLDGRDFNSSTTVIAISMHGSFQPCILA